MLSGIKGTAFEASERDRGQNGHAICLFFETWDPEEAEQDPVIREKQEGHRWRESDLCHGNGLCPGGSMDQRGLGKEPGENGNGNAGSLPGHRGTDRDRQDPPGDQRGA